VIKTDPTMATDNSYTLIWEVDSYSPIFEYLLKFKNQKVSKNMLNNILII
jgi:hypothetical protein